MSANPQWGVRLKRGVVTYINDEPLVTWEQAAQAREKIQEMTGEWGEVEKVYMLRADAAGEDYLIEPSDGLDLRGGRLL